MTIPCVHEFGILDELDNQKTLDLNELASMIIQVQEENRYMIHYGI